MSECIERSLTTKVNAFLICLMRAAHLSLQLARPKATATTLFVRVCVCGSGVCEFKCVRVCVCQSVNQPVANNANKPQQKFNNISMSFSATEGSLSNLSCRLLSLPPSPPLCANPSAPLCACASSLLCSCPCHSLSVCAACLPVVGASIILCRHNLTTGNAAHNKAKTTPTQQQLKGCEERNWN